MITSQGVTADAFVAACGSTAPLLHRRLDAHAARFHSATFDCSNQAPMVSMIDDHVKCA
jgi:hypothetical protein